MHQKRNTRLTNAAHVTTRPLLNMPWHLRLKHANNDG